MKNHEIKEIVKSGTRKRKKNLVIFQGDKTSGDMAAIVKANQGSAVKRNQFKRRVKHIHKNTHHPDSVYILKKGYKIPGYKILKDEIESLDE